MKTIIELEWEDIVPLILDRENTTDYINKYSTSYQNLLNHDEVVDYINASRETDGSSLLEDYELRKSEADLMDDHFNYIDIYAIVVVKTKDGKIHIKEVFEDSVYDDFDDIMDVITLHKGDEVKPAVEVKHTPSLGIITKPPFIK